MEKGNLAIDPRGLIFEAYRIEGIGHKECRSIFLDWALGVADSGDMTPHLQALMAEYGAANPDHPMTAVIREGMQRRAEPGRRRGGRMRRHSGL
jgi:hypothetical protein